MKKRNFLTTATLAALVAAQMAMPVMAQPATNKPGTDQHTTIGISEAKKKSAAQASFDVPLYLVVAAVENQADIEKPDNYKIENKTEGYPIGVTKMQIENLGDYTGADGTGWAIVNGNGGNPTIANNRQIALQLGTDLWMPETVNAGQNVKVDVLFAANSFFREADTVDGKPTYKKIEESTPLVIPVAGKVQATTRADKKATSQFKVTYTVSPLNADGTVFTATYVGDKKDEAGLD